MTAADRRRSACTIDLDVTRFEATRAGRTVRLTRSQFIVLQALVDADGAVVDREELGALLWGSDSDRSDGAIEAHVSALRRKLDDPFHIRSLVAVYGVGYRLIDVS